MSTLDISDEEPNITTEIEEVSDESEEVPDKEEMPALESESEEEQELKLEPIATEEVVEVAEEEVAVASETVEPEPVVEEPEPEPEVVEKINNCNCSNCEERIKELEEKLNKLINILIKSPSIPPVTRRELDNI